MSLLCLNTNEYSELLKCFKLENTRFEVFHCGIQSLLLSVDVLESAINILINLIEQLRLVSSKGLKSLQKVFNITARFHLNIELVVN
jgi:hypothetical protein